jgi:hypothetical protein
MKAVLSTSKIFNAQHPGGSKIIIDVLTVAVIRNGEIETPVRATFYMGRSNNASVVYCYLWVENRCSGNGQAGGYGYHKQSAALDAAIKSAGIKLTGSPYDDEHHENRQCHIDGCGSDSMHRALVAITWALGYRGKCKII